MLSVLIGFLSTVDTDARCFLQTQVSTFKTTKTMAEEASETSSITSRTRASQRNEENQELSLHKIPWKIYVSRALSAWGDRLWSFGAGIFMVELAPQNLRLVSVYGLVLSISVIILGAPIGNWIDKSQRLKAARVFLATQNLVTALSCAILGLYFGQVGQEYWPSWIPDAVPVITIILAALAQLASVGSKIVVEKDWIVVIAMENDDRLAKINAVFRTIDLTALTLSPLSAGLVFDLVSNYAAAYFIAAWNVVSVIFEYLLLSMIYEEFPQLSHKKIFEAPLEKSEDTSQEGQEAKSKKCNPCSRLLDAFKSWILYMKYPIRNAGLGLACLYMTVLGFDNITYGYCLQECVRESLLGGLVGVSAICGVSGSIAFPFLRRSLGLAKTGLFGFICLIGTLFLCVASIWIDGSPFDPYYFTDSHNTTEVVDPTEYCSSVSSYNSVIVLMVGLIMGRFGLWISDLTITQVLQEKVPEEHRGTIGGVQNGLNSAMDTIKFILVIALPQRETFGWLILASFASICIGAVSYTTYAIKLMRTAVKKSENPTALNQSDVKVSYL